MPCFFLRAIQSSIVLWLTVAAIFSRLIILVAAVLIIFPLKLVSMPSVEDRASAIRP